MSMHRSDHKAMALIDVQNLLETVIGAGPHNQRQSASRATLGGGYAARRFSSTLPNRTLVPRLATS